MSEADDQEYFSTEVTELVEKALEGSPALSMSWLETQLYEKLYTQLLKYMDKSDLLIALTDTRRSWLEGFSTVSPEKLHKVCKRCRLCNGVEHPAVDPGWNVIEPDLMIVVENPTVWRSHSDFLVQGLKAAGFRSDRCMLTYATRCPINSQDIQDQHLANCIPYLHSEMAACSPKLVLPLGAKTWGAITGDTVHKISEMEGDITWFGLYPMLPGMSLAWYARVGEGKSDRFVDLLSRAHNFLYSRNTTHTGG